MRRLLLCAVLLAGCRTRQPVRLVLQPPSTNNYPSYFASWLGFYKNEGVDVEISQVAGASKILEAVVSGSANVGGGVYEQTLQMKAEGKAVVAFVSLLKSPNFAIVGAPGVHSLKDLEGKAVGVSSVGSPSQFYLTYLLRNAGVDPAKVSTASVGMGATAMAALDRRQVEAAVLFGSAIPAYLARNPGAVILADTRTPEGLKAAFGVDNYPASCLLAKKEWLDGHPEDAKKMTRAVLRALEWIRIQPAEEVLSMVPNRGDPKMELSAIRLAKPMYSNDGLVSKNEAETVRGVIGLNVDPQGTFLFMK